METFEHKKTVGFARILYCIDKKDVCRVVTPL